MGEILKQFGIKHGDKVRSMKCDITNFPAHTALAIRDRWLWPQGSSWSVSTIPTTILFVNGKPGKTWYGAIPIQQLLVDLGAWL